MRALYCAAMSDSVTFSLHDFPAHLGLGATVVREPRFDGMEWYAAYGERHASDGVEGRLVAMFTFSKSWDAWEMHPKGYELVVCTAGTMTLHQEIDGALRTVTLHAGEAVINPPGVWHTADVDGTATALFVTAGQGTEHRPR
jgi:quercetin dioxygenase-like cupin family protein